MKQTVGLLHDVVLREAGDLLAIVAARILEGVAHDLLRARARNELEALHDFVGLLVLDAGVEILFVLAHNHEIHLRMLGVDVGVVRNARANVGVEAERLAGRDVEALEAAALRRRDRRFEEHFGASQRIPGAGFDADAHAALIDLFADFDGFDVESGARFFQNVKRGRHDFGADPIAMRNRDWCSRHLCLSLAL